MKRRQRSKLVDILAIEPNTTAPRRPGRPATGKTTPRQLGRVDDETWEVIQRAVKLENQTMTQFATETLTRRAKVIIRKHAKP
jgi:hypothetical protein